MAGDKPVGPTLPKASLVFPVEVDELTGAVTQPDWHPMTRRWWNHWRRSPQASRMLSQPDWDFLLDTALMHHVMWEKKRWEFASEIRLRVAKFGATPEDRLRLRQEIDIPETTPAGDGEGATVTSMAGRRGRLQDD
ncbi:MULTISPECIES: hypothetical protein [unclassified Pseudoclavibacter]|uniref:phage terminase small subunit n=1 Tax=unclassified Pseudoclavibacter TaxID=2615177 RepID=UPI001BA583CE|nr:hypothetical protein [Pseudoclavibacter sp. Marseille-Q4354]MBS3177742.1 hypothetical protein [Pseudoclavibacter sp. Marseille-Q4354]